MRLKLQKEKAILYSRATPAVLNILTGIEGRRRWAKNDQLVVERTEHNVKLLCQLPGVHVSEQLDEKRDHQPTVTTYKPKTDPMPHQKTAKEVRQNDRKYQNVFAFFMEQGTGKTWCGLEWMGELYASGAITGVIIVSKKGAHRQWIDEEIVEHFGAEIDAHFWPFKELPPTVLKGNNLKCVSFNWDGVKTAKALPMALKFAAAHQGRLLIIADESQEAKNTQSARFKAIDQLKPYSSHRAILTGTPIGTSLIDEWAQFKWLDERISGIKYATTFKREYCILGGFQNKNIIGHRNVDAFKRVTSPYIYRVTKEEIGIAPKLYNKWRFELTADQKRMMREIKKEFETVLNDGTEISIANALGVVTKLQQISSGFIFDKGGDPLSLSDRNPRLEAMKEWIMAGEGKAIIWFAFRPEAPAIVEALNGMGITTAEYHGGTKDKDRKLSKQSFLSRDGAQVLVANAKSAGTGLNLQGLCNRALYYSNTYNAIDRWQSEDRIHRIGVDGVCVYTDLIGVGSSDGAILSNLNRKKGLAQSVLDQRTVQPVSNVVDELAEMLAAIA